MDSFCALHFLHPRFGWRTDENRRMASEPLARITGFLFLLALLASVLRRVDNRQKARGAKRLISGCIFYRHSSSLSAYITLCVS
jgi:hypothetical protein